MKIKVLLESTSDVPMEEGQFATSNPFYIIKKHAKQYYAKKSSRLIGGLMRENTNAVKCYVRERSSKKMYVPVAPRIHPKGFYSLKKLQPNSKDVAIHMILLLKYKDSRNCVRITREELSAEIGIDVKTVGVALQRLIEAEVVLKLSKSRYFISPLFAWFGNEVTWELLLEEAEEQKLSLQELYDFMLLKFYTPGEDKIPLEEEEVEFIESFDDLCL